MSQRGAAEAMVRMLETETTEQRHMLAEERGKFAKLEALVIHLEVRVATYLRENRVSSNIYMRDW